MEIRRRKRHLPLHKSITEAGRLIGRRLAVSKQLLRESGPRFLERFWNRSHSSQPECDVVLTLPASTDQILLEWLLTTFRERLPQIRVRVTHHRFLKYIMLICTADISVLLKGAEELHIRKKIKDKYGGGFKEFCCDDPFGIWDVQDVERFLSTQERQEIVMFYINSMRTQAKDTVRGKLLLEGQSLIQRLRKERIIDQIYPLHEEEPLRRLKTSWVNQFFSSQPLDEVASYFGVKIAMYFGWLGHYTAALFFPAAVGLCIWIFCYGKDERREDMCFILFALLNVVWATLFLESWKRKSSELAHRWGTLDTSSEMLSEPRPLFKGELSPSEVTGRLEPHYPKWRRNVFRYLISVPVISVCLATVLGVMLLMLQLQTWTDKRYKDDTFRGWVMSMLPKILFALIIPIMDSVYKKIAVWLNDKENYRLEDTYENHLIMKISVFQFVNSFLSLFYIAFYLQDMDKLKDQLAALLITRQVVGNVRESLIPYVVETLCLAEMSAAKRRASVISVPSSPPRSPTTSTATTELTLSTTTSAAVCRRPPTGSTTRSDSTASSSSSCSSTGTSSGSSGNGSASTADVTSSVGREPPTRSGTPATADVAAAVKGGLNGDNVDTAERDIGSASRLSSQGNADDVACTRRDFVTKPSLGAGPTRAEMEAAMYRYEGTFEDYLEMFIQFGYVVLFSSAFPLAALCALVNNLVEIRSDAFKLCAIFQRPFGEPAENIGSWQDAMEVMGMIAVIVNCALVGFNGQLARMWPQLSALEIFVVAVLIEHVLLLLKWAIAFAIPDVPHWVQTEMAKVEFHRRETAKHHPQGSYSSTEMRSIQTQTDTTVTVAAASAAGLLTTSQHCKAAKAVADMEVSPRVAVCNCPTGCGQSCGDTETQPRQPQPHLATKPADC